MKNTREHINTDRHDFNNDVVLNINALPENPFILFESWLKEAIDHNEIEPYAMNVSTISNDGKPHSRIVYLRDFVDQNFVYYTNYMSQKGTDIRANDHVALCFFWPILQRQVRIEGTVVKASEELSNNYFKARPRKSKIGAWASKQSNELDTRDVLMDRVRALEERFEGTEIPRPEFWGGYVILPNYYEFWLGQPSRLHDRLAYKQNSKDWIRVKLNP